MFCSSCGKALSRPMKYCNHCGAQLVLIKDAAEIEKVEKRIDDYLAGLFWVAVIGLGIILGGLFLMKAVLNFGQGLIIAYMILSSTTFVTVFGLCLWQFFRIARQSKKEDDDVAKPKEFDTNKFREIEAGAPLEAVASVTENTTRELEEVSRQDIRG